MPEPFRWYMPLIPALGRRVQDQPALQELFPGQPPKPQRNPVSKNQKKKKKTEKERSSLKKKNSRCYDVSFCHRSSSLPLSPGALLSIVSYVTCAFFKSACQLEQRSTGEMAQGLRALSVLPRDPEFNSQQPHGGSQPP
ncbi:hypothetical protein I79_018587 [Cricetulus griseus]|uniref:Uncharacterized protein n=1 Tax=Cricetulus griseus TaxID=10029 RepID=G3I541_CRIGR|nr:hypothetical protein I79_018587 [Cricetulus griseus]